MVWKLCSRSQGQPEPGVRSAAMISIRRAMSREGFTGRPWRPERDRINAPDAANVVEIRIRHIMEYPDMILIIRGIYLMQYEVNTINFSSSKLMPS